MEFNPPTEVSGHRLIADPKLFNTRDPEIWEQVYNEVMNPKYKKGTRNFSRKIMGREWKGEGEPPIYLIPRERGGPSYKSVELNGAVSEDLQYCLVSKGFSQGDLSSFTLGPIVGHGLCLVNAAFSKSICIHHIEGGGKINLKRKNFWQRSRKPLRKIELIDSKTMNVDDIRVNIVEWLTLNEKEWFPVWQMWSDAVALCSNGDFHWCDDTPTISYRYHNRYIGFVEWKKKCYIYPSYKLLPDVPAYHFLEYVWKEKKVPLGLVHPMANSGMADPVTFDYIHQLFNDPDVMCCQPYVICGKLLDVPLE